MILEYCNVIVKVGLWYCDVEVGYGWSFGINCVGQVSGCM